MSHRARQYIVAAVVVGCLLMGVGVAVVQVGVSSVLVVPVAAVCWLALTVTWVQRVDGSSDSSPWVPIPQSQYLGRFAESGGLTKKEQEDALEERREE